MTNSTELIVLHTTKFSESSLVVHSLSKEYGRRSFLVKGIGKSAAMASFQPLNILEADVIESNKSRLWIAKNFHSLRPLNSLRSDIYKGTISLFLSEVLFKTLKEEGREEGLYEWCCGQIDLLEALESDYSNFHLHFLLGLAVALGFAPSSADLMPFVGENLATVEELLSKPFAEAMLIKMKGSERTQIARSLIKYLEFHLESAVNINSLDVLGELLR